LTKPALEVSATLGRDKLLVQPRAQMLYVLLDLKLNDEIGTSVQPLNLSLVLDHSSSMQRDDKLQRLKEAVSRIIDMMSPRDYLSIVTFGDRATVLLPCGPLGTKRAAKEALDAIRCRGGTEISTGLRAGLQELQTHATSLISQMIVLTDGQTYGDEDICVELATLAGERQVQITALGLGDDWNSVLLDELATRTGGHSDYVQGAEQLRGVFEDQLRTLQRTALRNLRVAVMPDVSSRVLRATWVAPGIKSLPIPNDAPAQPVHLDLGRVSTDREYRLLLEFVIASRKPGTMDVADLEFVYDVPALGLENQVSSCKVSAAFVDQWDSEPPVHLRVHDALRKITAHRLQEQALQAIQDGQTQKGTASLRTAAQHLEAAGSPDLAKLALAEADRVERQGQAQAGNMKRIIYGTRSLG
jgi:Ca-activated chloride channel family protein